MACISDSLAFNVALLFKVPATGKVIWRRGYSLKSHPKDLKMGIEPVMLVYKESGLSTEAPLHC